MAPARPLLAVHGGAGSRSITAEQRACLDVALRAGHRALASGRPAVEAVEQAICILEASGLFNAGAGSRLQLDGARRMDASLMEGGALKAGAVAAVEGILHPIRAARLVMDETDHVLLVGPAATAFATFCRLEPLPAPTLAQRRRDAAKRPPSARGKSLVLHQRMARARKLGTVGAVAIDRTGTVAAGASTGGVSIMLPGRVGDTPLIGCGVYADNLGGAVSMTGIGETIIRIAVAKEIVDRLARGEMVSSATRAVLRKLVLRTRGAAGALALTPKGQLAIQHTTARMAAGYWDGTGTPIVKDRFR